MGLGLPVDKKKMTSLNAYKCLFPCLSTLETLDSIRDGTYDLTELLLFQSFLVHFLLRTALLGFGSG